MKLTALQVRDALAARNYRLVLAESCTAGNVAGALAVVPGISAWLCGSFVVYRNESKAQWLGISRQQLDDPHIGPVSSAVTRQLASRALHATPEADVSAAVTGHIGPGCPADMDGLIFFCLAIRNPNELVEAHTRLTSPSPLDADDISGREARLQEATEWVLQQILAVVSGK